MNIQKQYKLLDEISSARSSLTDKALGLLKSFIQSESEITIQNWSDLAHELFMLNLPVDAEIAYLKAIEVSKSLSDKEQKELIVIYGDLAGVYEEMEDYSKAFEMLTRSYELRKTYNGEDNIFTQMSLERLRKLKIFMEYIPDKNLDEKLSKMVKDHRDSLKK